MTLHKPSKAFKNDSFFYATKEILETIYNNLGQIDVHILRQKKKDSGDEFHMEYTSCGCRNKNPRLAMGEALVLRLDRDGAITLSHWRFVAGKAQSLGQSTVNPHDNTPSQCRYLLENWIRELARMHNRNDEIVIRDAIMRDDPIEQLSSLGVRPRL